MLAPPPAARRREARGLAALALLPCQSACAAGPSTDNGVWWFASLALLLVAGAAFALGRSLERQRNSRDLHQARSALQRREALQTGWHWQTDARHQLLCWQGPGQAPRQRCALFEASTMAETLKAQLRSQRAFGPLRLQLAVAQDGACGWLLAGVPRLDERGGFDGFTGRAEPADEADSALAKGAAIDALLAGCSGAALL
ncbi:MAG TPA: hypothetical protein PLA97_21530, partial [Rubrivivax sp.]|nr:hypothetical protein [Rubrivivax sp.]